MTVNTTNPKSAPNHSPVNNISPLKKSKPKPNKSTEPLVLESDGGITLRAGTAVLRLLPSGELQLNGERIRLNANTQVNLNATQLLLNCED